MSKERIIQPDEVHNLELLKMLVRRAGVEWIVIHTNPKCEKRALSGLMAKGILGYLPIECIEREHGLSTRKKKAKTYRTKRPMFTRYLFAGLDAAEGQTVDDVRSCDGVKGVVSLAENGAPVRVSKDDLCRVIDVSHGTFEGEKLPDGFMADIASLPEGSKLKLVKGTWAGLDFALTGYDAAKERVFGVRRGASMDLRVDVALDEIDPAALPKRGKDQPDPSGTGESIRHKNGATEAA